MTRVDLHLHSRASTDTGSWFLARSLLPESYTEPAKAYAAAKARGMDLVTLTDHNTISGALEIAHLPDVLIGVEVTTAFPEDRTPLHVLVWGVDEARWADLDRLRPNVYELVSYLEGVDLPHSLAHPLHRLGAELTADHMERCLLLFRLWEGRNGARPEVGNAVTVEIARSASPEYLAKLAEKHDLQPRGDGPPALTGGSDDHGLIDVGATWTLTPSAADPAALLDHLRAGRCAAAGAHGSSERLAHAIVALGATAHAARKAELIPPALRGMVAGLIDPMSPSGTSGSDAESRERIASLALPSERAGRRRPRTGSTSAGSDTAAPPCALDPAAAHARLRRAIGWTHARMVRSAIERIAKTGGLLAGGALSEAAGLLVGAAGLSLPYLSAAAYQAGERRFAEDMRARFFGAPAIRHPLPRAVMATDTFDELNGAAGTLRRLAARSAECGRITVVASGEQRDELGVARLPPVMRMPVPAYGDAGWTLGVPPILDLLDLVEAADGAVVHAATPGPMGLCALAVARALGRPFVATYHTEISRYALDLTGDRLVASLTESMVGWFYRQAERVYVPSRATGRRLAAAGIDPSRLELFGRGIDTRQFDPARRSAAMRKRLGGGDTIILYVGRLSREKGLDHLVEAYRGLAPERPGLRLALVGEGPARPDLERALAGTRHRLLGALTGDELATAYASADLFCLPSTTETLGQVLLEAGASGLPAVATDQGGAGEVVQHGLTGLLARAGDREELGWCLGRLADDRALRTRLGRRARAAIRGRPTWEEVFTGLEDSYRDLRVGRALAAAGLSPAGWETPA